VRTVRSRSPRSHAVSRRIVLTDVTAMGGDAVCVAGIELASKHTMRLAQPQPTQRILAAFGGLAPGDVVDVNAQFLARPEAPHLEDCHWMPHSLKKSGTTSA